MKEEQLLTFKFCIVLNHRPFRLATGGVIPVLVKVEQEPPPAPATTTYAWASISTCATAPTTAALR